MKTLKAACWLLGLSCSLGIVSTVFASSDCDLDLGKQAFSTCSTCHTNGASETHAVGPNLYGVVGSDAGTARGFTYSVALEELDTKWTPEELSKFLASPMEYAPGTMMAYGGMKNEAQRNAVICYLEQSAEQLR
ncbi:c-type cytochrome [Halomonas ramblicola]|uniref:c-type cytochrome n=1 Tax=Halomonas ramblicola TaxID=747349 RepID=UPI0025B3335D|nr:c-type cytochrome [Halomonas ramblicola]MDN3522930.1 c-type cytochrome [Halomonas ramblicola]